MGLNRDYEMTFSILTSIPALPSYHLPNKVWEELLIHWRTVEVLECISNFTPHFVMDAITLCVVIGYDTRDREQRPVDYIFLNMFKQYRWKNKAL